MAKNRVRQLVLTGLFAALTVVGAYIKIPFYPVPFTLQTLVTALAGITLKPRWAALSQAVYLFLGLLGIPVFASGGGFGYILRPTFGYLLFLPVAAALISFLQTRIGVNSFRSTFLHVIMGHVLILFGGSVWLFVNVRYITAAEITLATALFSGAVIFIPSMLIKAMLAAFFSQRVNL